jgi:hypothetical protein
MKCYAINFLAEVAALFQATGATSAEKMAVVEPALPPHFSGVWCYNKIASEKQSKTSIFMTVETARHSWKSGTFLIRKLWC